MGATVIGGTRLFSGNDRGEGSVAKGSRVSNGNGCGDGAAKNTRDTLKDIRGFRELVARRATERDDAVIDCTDPERFGIVIQKLFEIGKTRFGIYSDHLCRLSFKNGPNGIVGDKPYWSNPIVYKAAQKFLERDDTLLEIAVGLKLDSPEGAGFAGSEFLNAVITSESRNGTIVIYLSANGKAGSEPLSEVNFVVCDDNGYRVEQPRDPAPAVLRFGRPESNRQLFTAFDEMADLFEQELECPTPNCLKLVYESTSKVVALPTSMNPGGNFDEIVSPYLTDQVKCPPTPNDVVWPGPSRWLKSFLGIAPTP